MSLLYKCESQRTYQISFTQTGQDIKIDIDGNIGKFGCDEPLFEWEGTAKEFVELIAKEK